MILTMSDETAEFGNSGVTVHRVTVLEKNNLKILPPPVSRGLPLGLGEKHLNIFEYVFAILIFWIGKKWIFTRKDPLLFDSWGLQMKCCCRHGRKEKGWEGMGGIVV